LPPSATAAGARRHHRVSRGWHLAAVMRRRILGADRDIRRRGREVRTTTIPIRRGGAGGVSDCA